MEQYPKYLYHATKQPVIVKSQDEHEAIGDDWAESPAEVSSLTEEPEDVSKKARKPRKVKEPEVTE
jgi:hypothetical protein